MTGIDEPQTPAGPHRSVRRFGLVALTLAGSYCLAANAAIALHELGHAVGIWLADGRVLGLYLALQGYAGSYAARDFSAPFATDQGRLLQVAGGPGFGAVCGVILVLVARCFMPGTVGWIATHGTGTWCFGNNGAYLVLGSLPPFGDALFLTELGVPRWVLFLAGLPIAVAFLPLFASHLRGIGLRGDDSYGRWIITVESGLLSYLAVVAAARWVWPLDWQPSPTTNDLLGLAASPVVVWFLATCTYPFRRASNRVVISEPRPRTAVGVLGLGVLFVSIELLCFSYDYEGASALQSSRLAG